MQLSESLSALGATFAINYGLLIPRRSMPALARVTVARMPALACVTLRDVQRGGGDVATTSMKMVEKMEVILIRIIFVFTHGMVAQLPINIVVPIVVVPRRPVSSIGISESITTFDGHLASSICSPRFTMGSNEIFRKIGASKNSDDARRLSAICVRGRSRDPGSASPATHDDTFWRVALPFMRPELSIFKSRVTALKFKPAEAISSSISDFGTGGLLLISFKNAPAITACRH
eukprot:g268.t1